MAVKESVMTWIGATTLVGFTTLYTFANRSAQPVAILIPLGTAYFVAGVGVNSLAFKVSQPILEKNLRLSQILTALAVIAVLVAFWTIPLWIDSSIGAHGGTGLLLTGFGWASLRRSNKRELIIAALNLKMEELKAGKS